MVIVEMGPPFALSVATAVAVSTLCVVRLVCSLLLIADDREAISDDLAASSEESAEYAPVSVEKRLAKEAVSKSEVCVEEETPAEVESCADAYRAAQMSDDTIAQDAALLEFMMLANGECSK